MPGLVVPLVRTRQPFGVAERSVGVEREFIDQFAELHRAAYGCRSCSDCPSVGRGVTVPPPIARLAGLDCVAVRGAEAECVKSQLWWWSDDRERGCGQGGDWWQGLHFYGCDDASDRRRQRLLPKNEFGESCENAEQRLRLTTRPRAAHRNTANPRSYPMATSVASGSTASCRIALARSA